MQQNWHIFFTVYPRFFKKLNSPNSNNTSRSYFDVILKTFDFFNLILITEMFGLALFLTKPFSNQNSFQINPQSQSYLPNSIG